MSVFDLFGYLANFDALGQITIILMTLTGVIVGFQRPSLDRAMILPALIVIVAGCTSAIASSGIDKGEVIWSRFLFYGANFAAAFFLSVIAGTASRLFNDSFIESRDGMHRP